MAQELHALTLVLGTQRSGPTLPCRDIASLGGLGSPDEYFPDILGKNVRPGLSEKDVLERIARGVQDDSPGIGAVKLMVDYASDIDAYIRGGGKPVPPYEAVQNIIDWA
jgi:LPS sulfotransferase NodH